MLNIEKYKDDILNEIHSNITCCANNLRHGNSCSKKVCKSCKKAAMNWLLSEYKESILDDAEKKYLSAVIKPYKNKVIGILKINDFYESNFQYIRIMVKIHVGIENINLPWFEGNTMYKGMKANKEYTLEELGL